MNPRIRPEAASDHQAIFDVNRLAFGQEDESLLVNSLREGETFVAELSMVAELEDKVIGHILFSTIWIIGKNKYESLALAPMAVLPEYQRKGIGSALVRAGLGRAKKLGFRSVFVLGHPAYYPNFGFQPASKWNIRCPFNVADEVFMAMELVTGTLETQAGMVQYPAAFLGV